MANPSMKKLLLRLMPRNKVILKKWSLRTSRVRVKVNPTKLINHSMELRHRSNNPFSTLSRH